MPPQFNFSTCARIMRAHLKRAQFDNQTCTKPSILLLFHPLFRHLTSQRPCWLEMHLCHNCRFFYKVTCLLLKVLSIIVPSQPPTTTPRISKLPTRPTRPRKSPRPSFGDQTIMADQLLKKITELTDQNRNKTKFGCIRTTNRQGTTKQSFS